MRSERCASAGEAIWLVISGSPCRATIIMGFCSEKSKWLVPAWSPNHEREDEETITRPQDLLHRASNSASLIASSHGHPRSEAFAANFSLGYYRECNLNELCWATADPPLSITTTRSGHALRRPWSKCPCYETLAFPPAAFSFFASSLVFTSSSSRPSVKSHIMPSSPLAQLVPHRLDRTAGTRYSNAGWA